LFDVKGGIIMVPYIIAGIILLYAAFVVYKKIKDFKAGKTCGCGCASCPSKGKCGEFK